MPGPNTLLGRPTLFEFRGKLKESFRRRGLTDGRNVGEMRKSGRAASFVGARRRGGKRRAKSRTSRFWDFRFCPQLPHRCPRHAVFFRDFRDGGCTNRVLIR